MKVVKDIVWMWVCFIPTIFLIFLSGCASDNEMTSSQGGFLGDDTVLILEEGDTNGYSDLLISLEEFSDDFLSSHAVPSSVSRKWGWNKFWDSVKADFIEIKDRTIIGSVGQSRAKWKEHKPVDIDTAIVAVNPRPRIVIKNKVDSLIDVYSTDTLNFGALHNAVILNTLLENTFNFTSTKELVETSIGSCKSLGIVLPATDVDEYIRSIDTFFEEIYDENVSVMYDRLTARQPSKASYYDVLEKYLNTVQNFSSIKDIKDYTTGYTQLIQRSDITIAEANDLLRNISIAPASYELWSDIENLVTK